MISLLLWFAVLSSGGVLCAAVWKRKYEEILPITCSAIVLVLFICGIAGNLPAGAVLVCAMASASYITAVVWLIRRKDRKEFVVNFFTPGFWGLVIVFVSFCILNYGRVAYSWDEFSHWADIVKAMATVNDFGTNPEAHSTFQSYPPGMPLFQYFLQKLYQWTDSAAFNEGHLYVAYQTFLFSFMLPFVKNINRKKPFMLLVSIIVLFLSPTMFFSYTYVSVYIDPILGLLSGTGMAAVFLCKKRDVIYSLQILSTIAMLVLAKDAGMLFAGFLAIIYVLDYVYGNRMDSGMSAGKFHYRRWICVPSALLAIAIPKLLWSSHLKITEANIAFSAPYDISKLIQIITGQETGWQRTLFIQFFRELVDQRVQIGNTGIYLNYYVLLLCLISALAVLCRLYEQKNQGYHWKSRMLLVGVSIQSAVYIVGLCFTYIFKFTEYEATRFVSFDRYMNIVCLTVWLIVVMLFLQLLQEKTSISLVTALVVITVFMSTAPLVNVLGYLSRGYVRNSLAAKAPYQQLIDDINSIPQTSHIYFICQESNGLAYWIVRYNSRPHFFNADGWSVGEAFYNGDVWTKEMAVEKWQEDLLQSYDYVALSKVNDYFIDHYAALFESDKEIRNNTLFKVNKETGLLERYGE